MNDHSEVDQGRRRTLLQAIAGGTAATFFGPWRVNHAWAQAAQKKPLVIGLTMDASGQYAASGAEERLGAMMAIKEFNEKGGVLGRRIEAIHMDTETTPATGSRVAERMITRNECAFLIGAIHSGVANAISQVAQKYGCVYLNSNSSSPTEIGKDCHRVKFVWDGNGTNFAHAIVKNAINVNGKRWVMLTNDYVWGHSTAKAMRTLVEANGGQIVEELLVPQNTRDFSAYLLKVQQIKPNVVATAVGVSLILMPLAAIGWAHVVGLQGPAFQAGVLQSSMPTAVMATILALEFDAQPQFVTSVVCIATLLSPLTVTLLIAYLQRGG